MAQVALGVKHTARKHSKVVLHIRATGLLFRGMICESPCASLRMTGFACDVLGRDVNLRDPGSSVLCVELSGLYSDVQSMLPIPLCVRESEHAPRMTPPFERIVGP